VLQLFHNRVRDRPGTYLFDVPRAAVPRHADVLSGGDASSRRAPPPTWRYERRSLLPSAYGTAEKEFRLGIDALGQRVSAFHCIGLFLSLW
jgi:hypothetical protein